MNIQLSDHFDTKRLLRFALPSILMMVFTSVYGVVDGFFVSNFVGKTPFAAVNFIMPFLMILGALGFMLGTGGSALIGKLLGEENGEKANQVFSLLIYVTLIAGVVVAVVGMLVVRHQLRKISFAVRNQHDILKADLVGFLHVRRHDFILRITYERHNNLPDS